MINKLKILSNLLKAEGLSAEASYLNKLIKLADNSSTILPLTVGTIHPGEEISGNVSSEQVDVETDKDEHTQVRMRDDTDVAAIESGTESGVFICTDRGGKRGLDTKIEYDRDSSSLDGQTEVELVFRASNYFIRAFLDSDGTKEYTSNNGKISKDAFAAYIRNLNMCLSDKDKLILHRIVAGLL